jgi:hypothetical protein
MHVTVRFMLRTLNMGKEAKNPVARRLVKFYKSSFARICQKRTGDTGKGYRRLVECI